MIFSKQFSQFPHFVSDILKRLNLCLQFSSGKLINFRKSGFLLIGLLFIFFISEKSLAATYYSRISGNWNTNSTWSTTSGGAAATNYPKSGDIVYIERGYTVTVTADATCTSLSFGISGGTTVGNLTINSNCILNATDVTLNKIANAAVSATIQGAGTLNSTTLNVGSSINSPTGNNTTRTHTLISTLSFLNVSGNVNINSYFLANNRFRNGIFTVNSGQLTVGGSIVTTNQNSTNAALFTLGASSPTLILSGATPFMISATGTNTITLNGTGSTVNYSYSGAQTVYSSPYVNLNLSGSGVKTLQSGTSSVTGNMTLSGTASATTVANLSVGGNLTVGAGTIFTTGSNFTLGVTGTTPVTGSLVLGGTGTKTFTGDVTLNNGAVWNETGIAAISFAGNLTHNGSSFTSNTGVHTFSGSSKSVSGASAITIPSVSLSGTYTNSNTAGLTVSSTFAGAGTLTQGANAILNIGSSTVTPTLVATAAGNTVDYNSTGIQTIKPASYYYLILQGSGAKTFPAGTTTISNLLSVEGTATTALTGTISYGSDAILQYKGSSSQTTGSEFPSAFSGSGGVIIDNASGVYLNGDKTIDGALDLLSGNLILGNYNFTLGTSGTITGSPSVSNMIVTSGTGSLRKTVTALSPSFTFPVGDNTGTIEYSPFSITLNSATYSTGSLIAVRVTDAKHDSIKGTTNFISRYWTVSQSGLTDFSADVSGTFLTADLGAFAYGYIISSKYNINNREWTDHNMATATTISASGITSLGDFTGRNNVPTILASPPTLTGLNYMLGYGPSAIQSFTVSGSGLNTNIEILPTDSFEISTLNGIYFSPSALVRLNVINREVAATPVYVRLKSGFQVNSNINDTIKCTSVNASNANVVCIGDVTDKSSISLSSTSRTGFTYNLGGGPSASQSVTVTGTYLVADILITAPTDYEVALSSGGTYASSLTLTQAGGNVNTTIYIRLKSGLSAAIYNESFTLTSTNADSKTITCEGEVKRASLSVSKLSLAGFIYASGSSSSSIQTFTVSGSTLAADISVTPPADFEISFNGTTFYSTVQYISYGSGTVNATTVYVRMKGGLSVNTYSNENITVASTGAISQTVKCSGQVTSGTATIGSVSTLNGFFYLLGSGPSVNQSFTVSGTNLSGPIVVTSNYSDEFELSSDGSSFSSFLTVANTGSVVNAVTVYVRLKAGLAVADYSSRSVTLSSANATDVNIALNGKVVAKPELNASADKTDSICIGETVNLSSSGTVDNWSWTGPSSFTSALQNPSISSVTLSSSGNYIVSSNVLSGVNLITNGDFELGNQDFGSTYTYKTTGGTSNPYGTYWIMASPSSANSSYFRNTTDHSATGTLQMIVDGSETAGAIIWSQTIAVSPNSDYIFEYFGQNVSITDVTNVGKLQLYVNNVPTGSLNVLKTQGWVGFSTSFNSSSSTSVQLTLINSHTGGAGNDFAIDDISMQQIVAIKDTVSLSVIPTLTPSVSISASANPVYSGTIVTYTANVINAGPSYSFQWYVDDVLQSGKTAVTFDYTPTNGQKIKCIVTSQYNCLTVNPVTSNVVTMTVLDRTNFWYGGVSTDWGTPANWTGGFVPLAGNDVVFATSSNNNNRPAQRNLVLDIDRTIGNLINATDLALIIPEGKALTVNNSISFTNTSASLIQIKAGSDLPNGALIFNNSQSNPVYATVEMYSKASWDLSMPVNQKYNWQFFGIPVSSLTASPTFDGAYVRQMLEDKDQINNHWESLNNNSVLSTFRGYEICQKVPKTYTFTGQLNNANFSSGQLVRTTTGNPLYPGQHLLANSYTSAIKVKNIDFGSDMEATVYIYNTGSYNSWSNQKASLDTLYVPGQYNTIPKNQAGYAGILAQIPSMSAFLVRIDKTKTLVSTPNCYVNIVYSNVVASNSEKQRITADLNETVNNQATSVVDVMGEYGADKMWLMINSNYTNGYDDGYDGYKIEGNALNPQLYAYAEGNKLQINSVPDINNTLLFFRAGVDKEYTIRFNHNDIIYEKYDKIFLHDLVDNIVTDISISGTKYRFNASSASGNVARFRILASKKDHPAAHKTMSSVYVNDHKIYIQNLTEMAGKVLIYDITGRILAEEQIDSFRNIEFNGLTPKIYIVRCVIGNSTETTKIVLP